MIRCGPSLKSRKIKSSTMTSADFCKCIIGHLWSISSLQKKREHTDRSPRVRQITVTTQPRCLRQTPLVIMGFGLWGNLARRKTPYTTFVYLGWSIWIYASFRFHLAIDTLALTYQLGLPPPARYFHPKAICHAWRTSLALPPLKISNTTTSQVM